MVSSHNRQNSLSKANRPFFITKGKKKTDNSEAKSSNTKLNSIRHLTSDESKKQRKLELILQVGTTHWVNTSCGNSKNNDF